MAVLCRGPSPCGHRALAAPHPSCAVGVGAQRSAAQDFQSASTGVAAKAMRNALNKLVAGVEDPKARKGFEAEMNSFFLLFNRYLSERAKGKKMCVASRRPS